MASRTDGGTCTRMVQSDNWGLSSACVDPVARSRVPQNFSVSLFNSENLIKCADFASAHKSFTLTFPRDQSVGTDQLRRDENRTAT